MAGFYKFIYHSLIHRDDHFRYNTVYRPPGRIAKWTSIPILGLEKDQWQALHTIFTFLFIIANGFHLYFNWKPFLSYLSDKKKQFFRLRRELLSAIFIVAGIFYLILLNTPPFKTVMDFGESMKNEWSVDSSEPPAKALCVIWVRAITNHRSTS
ncbi:MAG: DUF4405 domain-containing protein [Calditrichia bacterium]